MCIRDSIKNVITIGDIQAFIQYVKNLTQPVQQVAQVTNMMQQMAAAAERVFELLEEKEEEQIVENPVSTEGIKGEVTFEHVKFGYNPDQIIIKDFSAHVKPGQQVAIVGPTGAGKTTMVKLLMRFYDVNGGAILLDGHNIKDFNRRELRDVFGMVLQDTWLFHGSIRENIRYGKLDATDEEVIQAAKAAHVHRFVKTLPGGYDMELNEEASNVSQGQKQLLCIARVMLMHPAMLILDEALDAEAAGLLENGALAALVRLHPEREFLLTGHTLTPEWRETADYLTHMQKLRHPYDSGISGRSGIEW